MNKENPIIGTTMIVELTKPKRVGRPSKKDKLIYGIKHTLTIPEDSPFDTNIRMELFQKEIEKLGLPVKLVNHE